ncbi:BMP family ABC transporter substrate-binding protein [Ornithinimicrobium cryptoxanthini]|uniref:BMP family ABC transporter substrate-binding protein n=2 Tax=Ornithinimicrobium cryptoxanthini TaxID=2934161 RepID=A0ABY4YKQ9_9MICO|nr:BMP family ABC transporter substrate-binding protein [Ornithinimicrobium cryptoxanthini]USQ77207.1 BMP family ABC transporter substrate-binding protein [Ornithinimicrobium cryptoxanthini]
MRVFKIAAASAAAVMVLAACGEAPSEDNETEAASPAAPADNNDDTTATEDAAPAEDNSDFKACMVSDAGGFDDQSFNQGAYSGLLAAEDSLGISKAEAESNSDAEFGPNIDAMVQQDCDFVIGVGFLLEDAIQAAAEANPDTNFGLLDSAFSDADFAPVELDNGKPILFNTAEASFLAGYLAAGMTETGTVATYGGLPLPSVQIFMDGFSDGINKYNEDNSTEVELLGWDKEAQEGSFAGSFDDQTQGASLGEQFISQGADIIMPVAGPVGLGTASVAEGTDTKLIWVDSDGFDTTEYGDLILTSVLKDMGPAVEGTIKETIEGAFSNEPYVGTLENGGVSLAPFHDFESEVPQELKDKLAEYEQQIISGELVVESPNSP